MERPYPLPARDTRRRTRIGETVLFFVLLLFSFHTFSQSCGTMPNYGFQQGTTTGWECKYGTYGRGPCPLPLTNICPTFWTNDTAYGCLNANGNNAALNTGVDRHTIMDAS